MNITFDWKQLVIKNEVIPIIKFPATCRVRNEINGHRSLDQVVYTLPESGKPKPYYPRPFPSGIFKIIDIEYTDDLEYAPVKIKTNATREVFTWDLDKEGNYWKPTGKTQIDTCYWLHFTT